MKVIREILGIVDDGKHKITYARMEEGDEVYSAYGDGFEVGQIVKTIYDNRWDCLKFWSPKDPPKAKV